MEDRSHLLQYQRFFALTLAVLPGVELCYGLAGLVLYLVGDVLGEDGWAMGGGGITFFLTLSGWVFIGNAITSWAEEKSAGFLAALSIPFILVMLGIMISLFFSTVLGAHGPGTETASAIVSQLRALA